MNQLTDALAVLNRLNSIHKKLEKTLGYMQGYSWNDPSSKLLCARLDYIERLISEVKSDISKLSPN